MVDSVLAEGGIALSALDAIAFGRGPGGFTGVRLAASVAQGLAFGAQVGVVPISDLAAVAQRVVQLNSSVRRVLVANDARMKEVYWATFEVDGVLTSGAEHVSAAAEVAAAAGPRRGLGCRRAWPRGLARAGGALPGGGRGTSRRPAAARQRGADARAARGGGRPNPRSGRCIARLCQGPGCTIPCNQTAIDCRCNAHATKTSPVMPCQQPCQPNRFW